MPTPLAAAPVRAMNGETRLESIASIAVCWSLRSSLSWRTASPFTVNGLRPRIGFQKIQAFGRRLACCTRRSGSLTSMPITSSVPWSTSRRTACTTGVAGEARGAGLVDEHPPAGTGGPSGSPPARRRGVWSEACEWSAFAEGPIELPERDARVGGPRSGVLAGRALPARAGVGLVPREIREQVAEHVPVLERPRIATAGRRITRWPPRWSQSKGGGEVEPRMREGEWSGCPRRPHDRAAGFELQWSMSPGSTPSM